MAIDDDVISFTASRESAKGIPPKQFALKRGSDAIIRIGRAPGNDIVVEFRGVSQYHAELRASLEGLCLRDLSMNGTGLKKPDAKEPFNLTKGVDVGVPHGAAILVPMLLKESQSANERAWIKIEFGSEGMAVGAGLPSKEKREPVGNGAKANSGGAKAQGQSSPPIPPQAPRAASPAAGAASDGSGDAPDEAAEKNRMQFVELLLKTREVSAGTTYEEARKLLGTGSAWHAVDESTRKECFDIFVEHLGNHQSQKKDKKKEKDKGKKQHKQREENTQKEEPRGKRRKEPEKKGVSRSASPDRLHRKGKHEKKCPRRSKSRAMSCSRSGSRARGRDQKRRRRGRSGSG